MMAQETSEQFRDTKCNAKQKLNQSPIKKYVDIYKIKTLSKTFLLKTFAVKFKFTEIRRLFRFFFGYHCMLSMKRLTTTQRISSYIFKLSNIDVDRGITMKQ